jgi:ADP-ribose pyrophosphatase YjhB (NUDIX family)
MTFEDEIYQIADELRAIASNGLYFSEDSYDRERYEKALELSSRLIALLENRPSDEVHLEFQDTLLHLSPLVGVSSFVQKDGKVLLIQREDNGLWALPGGLVDVGEILSDAAVRELEEEAGISGTPVDLLGVFDSRLWRTQTKSHLFHFVFLVEVENPNPKPGPEALAADFFPASDLPELSPSYVRRLPMILRILNGEIPRPYFDGRFGVDCSYDAA